MTFSPSQRVKLLAREAGFDLARVAPAEPMQPEGARFLTWIEEGRQADMRWMTEERARRAADPQTVLPGARSVICLGVSYWAGHRPAGNDREGRVARYAWGRDYHAVLEERMRALCERLQQEFGGSHRAYVDTGPLMDRALAARSGIGWYGKNSNILTETFGSYVLLGEVVTTLDLAPDPPLNRTCGSCRLCMVACPTGAIDAEYRIDSRRCISYLTIEHRGPIPLELRAAMGDWVFGCDICQDVCPPTMRSYLSGDGERRAWAEDLRAYAGHEPTAATHLVAPSRGDLGNSQLGETLHPAADLYWLMALTHEEYVSAFRGTAIKRAKVWMLRRNAAIALGNVGSADAVPHLSRALREDESEIVRGHAAWALGRLGVRLRDPTAGAALQGALDLETDESVRDEIRSALTMISAGCSIRENPHEEKVP